MELFAMKLDNQDVCPVLENETIEIVGYLEDGEKGFYIHLDDRVVYKLLAKDEYAPYSGHL